MTMIKITIPGACVPKPRMTHSDSWKKRTCVVEYYSWKDIVAFSIRQCKLTTVEQSLLASRTPCTLEVHFYLEFPKGYKEIRKNELRGKLHDIKPDVDNMLKSVMDCIFSESDAHIWRVTCCKTWEDEHGPRTEVTIRY